MYGENTSMAKKTQRIDTLAYTVLTVRLRCTSKKKQQSWNFIVGPRVCISKPLEGRKLYFTILVPVAYWL